MSVCRSICLSDLLQLCLRFMDDMNNMDFIAYMVYIVYKIYYISSPRVFKTC